MRLVRLTPDYQFSEFDCGDGDLNDFLVEDAKPFLDKRIANTYILEDEGRIVAYFCLLNDKISRLEVTNSRWKSIPIFSTFSVHFGEILNEKMPYK